MSATQAELPVGTKEMTLVPASSDPTMQMIERLSSNPDVDVSKIERLIALHERAIDREAEAAFNASFATMQADIPEINERGQIKGRDGKVQSQYAKHEDIQKVLKPILILHGFALSFRSEWPDKNTVKVVGVLTHVRGHARESEFMSIADDSGSKNAIQGLGSAVSYGRRYTTIDLLNITTRGADDDGQKAGARKSPDGFDAWLTHMEAVATKGVDALTAAWEASDSIYKNFILVKDWEAMKATAKAVKRA